MIKIRIVEINENRSYINPCYIRIEVWEDKEYLGYFWNSIPKLKDNLFKYGIENFEDFKEQLKDKI